MNARARRNRLRVIGGRWRGRRFDFEDTPGLRPTIDRVRETLFNWLAPVIDGARVLDLFAGSGALGIEAASRGAARVVQVDSTASVVSRLRRWRDTLDAGDTIDIVQSDALAYLGRRSDETFDVAFVDPPYGHDLVDPVCRALESGGWLASGAYIYIETERSLGEPDLPEGWRLHRSKHAGRVGYHLAIRESS